MTLGVLIHGSVTPREKPYIRFLFVISDFCLQLPSDPRSHGTPLPATIGFQSLWLLKDLRLFPSHLLDLLHARHTKNAAPLELNTKYLLVYKNYDLQSPKVIVPISIQAQDYHSCRKCCFFEPQRGDILVDQVRFCIRVRRGGAIFF